MLTDKDRQFIIYWEKVRLKESSFSHKILSGLPMALIFGLPVLFFLATVKIFFPAWFTTASHKQTDVVVPGLTEKFMKVSAGDITTAFIAVEIIVLFFSFFRMHFKWEMNEQLYKELKAKAKKSDNFVE